MCVCPQTLASSLSYLPGCRLYQRTFFLGQQDDKLSAGDCAAVLAPANCSTVSSNCKDELKGELEKGRIPTVHALKIVSDDCRNSELRQRWLIRFQFLQRPRRAVFLVNMPGTSVALMGRSCSIIESHTELGALEPCD